MATYKGHIHNNLPNSKKNLPSPEPVTPSTRVNPREVERPKYQLYNRTVGKFLGKVNEKVDKVIMGKDSTQTLLQGNLNKGWRGLIILNRLGINPLKYTDKYLFDYIDKGKNWALQNAGGLTKLASVFKKPNNRDLPSSGGGGNQTWVSHEGIQGEHVAASKKWGEKLSRRVLINEEGTNFFTLFDDGYNAEGEVLYDPSGAQKNSILIFNPLIERGVGLPLYVELQNRPDEIDYQPQSSWADIKSMGRNVPMYHYTGSETTLQFTTSWYMPSEPGKPDFDLYWVINQCRLLESWTMANGYLMAPPYLYIRWGDSDLFSEHLWILQSATYKLRDFHDKLLLKKFQGDTHELNDNITGTDLAYSAKPSEVSLINQGLVPFSATQELIFKRVAGINLWYNDIAPQKHSLKTKL